MLFAAISNTFVSEPLRSGSDNAKAKNGQHAEKMRHAEKIHLEKLLDVEDKLLHTIDDHNEIIKQNSSVAKLIHLFSGLGGRARSHRVVQCSPGIATGWD